MLLWALIRLHAGKRDALDVSLLTFSSFSRICCMIILSFLFYLANVLDFTYLFQFPIYRMCFLPNVRHISIVFLSLPSVSASPLLLLFVLLLKLSAYTFTPSLVHPVIYFSVYKVFYDHGLFCRWNVYLRIRVRSFCPMFTSLSHIVSQSPHLADPCCLTRLVAFFI